MKIILDEDTPAPLRTYLIGHDVSTVPHMGWAGVKNGSLLRLIESSEFDVFLTCDQNLKFQQNLSARPFALIVLQAPNKKMETLLPLVPQILTLLQTALPGRIYHVAKVPEEDASEPALSANSSS